MPSGEKSTPALAAHARAQKVSARVRADIAAKLAQSSKSSASPIKQYIDKKEVLRRIGGFAYPTVWKWMRDGTFPQAFMVGGKLVWLEHEICDWIDAQPRAA